MMMSQPRASPQVLFEPQFMLKYVDSTVLSAAFVCLVTLYASERAFSRKQHLSGPHVR
jgi:hypothetical protein